MPKHKVGDWIICTRMVDFKLSTQEFFGTVQLITDIRQKNFVKMFEPSLRKYTYSFTPLVKSKHRGESYCEDFEVIDLTQEQKLIALIGGGIVTLTDEQIKLASDHLPF